MELSQCKSTYFQGVIQLLQTKVLPVFQVKIHHLPTGN